MKIYIISSDYYPKGHRKNFSVVFDNTFSERVIKHVTNEYKDLCNGCGKDCDFCRDKFPKLFPVDFKGDIAGILRLPGEMPYNVDNPEEFLPKELPPHDLLMAINIHDDVLLALPKMVKDAGGRGIIVPIEDPNWVSRWVRNKMREICRKLGIEVDFPKPFCAYKEGRNPFLDEAMKYFRIGKPKIQIKVQDGIIIDAQVITCAPCGNTYFVAKNLIGKKVDENINVETTAKYWHSYPCVASMEVDNELGDTPLHIGGFMHYDAVEEGIKETVPDFKAKR